MNDIGTDNEMMADDGAADDKPAVEDEMINVP